MASDVLASLETTFGKVPKLVDENLKYFKYNTSSQEFTCVLCNFDIRKASGASTRLFFKNHLSSKLHVDNSVSTDKLWQVLNKTFPGENIPQNVLNNILLLDLKEENYNCAICSSIITPTEYSAVTEKNFSYHFLSEVHVENLKIYRNVQTQLEDVYGEIPQLVLNNKHFLKCTGGNYSCVICDETIVICPEDLEKTERTFTKHLYSLKHREYAKDANAFCCIPELKQIYDYLPNYILRNIDYITYNGSNFFCCLCNENIIFKQHNPYETEQNFKTHMLYSTHEQKLTYRRNRKNEVFKKLSNLFDTFPDLVFQNLKYVTLSQNELSCSICQEFIEVGEYNEDTVVRITVHLESCEHASNLNAEMERRAWVTESLEDLFGHTPQVIQDNIQHIEFIKENCFQCVVCGVTLQSKDNGDYELNMSVTKNNFAKHFDSHKHSAMLGNLSLLSGSLQADLEELFGCIPQFIESNLDYIGYKDKSEDYYCFLCEKTIILDKGTKAREVTLQNFMAHLLSSSHFDLVKQKANKVMITTDKLDSIFGKVPHFVMSNVEHFHSIYEGFYCVACNVKISRGNTPQTTGVNFYQHLAGISHKTNVGDLDSLGDLAFQQLDFFFWRVPEFLMRNMDFLQVSDNNLYCCLCQENLPLDADHLEETKQLLRCHFDSDYHLYNVQSF